MSQFFNHAIGRLRLISILEALSYIYLLYCSIYLKRMLGDAEAIRIPGMIHGLLFCVYCVTLFQATEAGKWSLKKAFLYFLASLVPIVPFFLEPKLKREQLASNQAN
ncbi:DUF3817 domain-containing protein [Rubritalea marina]|uniref:DUF3817 domain-containing protein n=1 Tax=Rubritalea marina TaxID=361055 RepID=UPI0003713D74|nr:DUF3817 domain-containing protein [Rubritalea marina]